MANRSLRYRANTAIDVIAIVRLLIETGVQRASLLDLDDLVRLEAVREEKVTAQDILDRLQPNRFEANVGMDRV